MTDLVIGAGGFVGPHLVARLRGQGGDVVAVDLRRGAGIDRVCDVTDAAQVDRLMAEVRPRRVFHLAALSSLAEAREDPEATYRVNAEGPMNVLLACRHHAPGCRVLFVSTANVYGDAPEVANPLREERRPYPMEPYAASKLLAETLCDVLGGDGRIRVIVARAFNHTGPGQQSRFVVPALAEQVADVARGRCEPVIRVGNLEPQRDFSDVRDVVRVYDELLHHGEPGQIYNVCSGRARTIHSILVDLLRVAEVEARVVPDPERQRPADIQVLVGDPTRLLDTLGWAPAPLGDATLREIVDGAMRA